MPEVNGTSILGFIPTQYPCGVFLGEQWDSEQRTIVRVLGDLDDIDGNTTISVVRRLPIGMDPRDAYGEFLGFAIDSGIVPEWATA